MPLGYQNHRFKLYQIRLLIVLVVLACGLMGWSVLGRFGVERDMAARRQASEKEYHALQYRRDALKAEVAYLNNERGREAEARKHFNVAKVGESVVIILDQDKTTPTTNQKRAKVSPPWWQFWR